jgi:hypothetical protein
MTNKDHEKIEPTPEQMNPFLAQAIDFIIGEDSDTPGHGQCRANRREYAKLLRNAANAKGKSNFVGEQGRPTEASDASKPRTEGIGDGDD